MSEELTLEVILITVAKKRSVKHRGILSFIQPFGIN